MKRGKKLLILLLALAVLGGGAFAAGKLSDKIDDDGESETVLFSVDADAVTDLSWTYEGSKLALTRSGDEWSYKYDSEFPLDTAQADSIISAVSEIHSHRTIEGVEDLSEYGLDEPLVDLTVTAGDEFSLSIGTENATGGYRYASVGDGNVYLIESGIFDSFDIGLYDLVAKEEIPSMTDITKFTVDAETQSLDLRYIPDSGLAYSDEYVWFLTNGDEYTALDTEAVNTLTGSITGLTWMSCVDYNADDLSEYGLDAPSAIVTVYYTDDADDAEHFTLCIGAYSANGCYACIDGSSMVYEIDSSVCDALLYTGLDELKPNDVIKIDLLSTASIDLSIGDSKWKISRTTETASDSDGNEYDETVYTCAGETVDTDAFEDALYELSMLTPNSRADGITPERDEMMRLTVHTSKADWPEVSLVFYEYDSTECLAVLNGDTTTLVSRDSVTAIITALKDTLA